MRTVESLIASALKACSTPDPEAEDVARQVEGADLPATVLEELVGAYRAAHHLVEVLGFLSLAEDFGIPCEMDRGAVDLKGRGKCPGADRRGGGLGDGCTNRSGAGDLLSRVCMARCSG